MSVDRIKPFYTVTELAALAGCSRATMYRRLKRHGVEFRRGPIPITDIRRYLGELWEARELARIMSSFHSD